MQLTLFTLPKRFDGVFATIQHNALKSWLELKPTPEIFLFGDESGTREAAALYGLRHFPELAVNALGTPLVNHLFRTATQYTRTPYQAFVNADIILDPGLPDLLDKVIAQKSRSLIVSRRWDIDLNEPLATDQPGWFERLAQRVRREGELYSHHGMDLFVFPTGFLDHMPPFSIGWPGAKYDNWMVYAARKKGVPVVEVTHALTNIHQNHPTGGTPNPAKALEHWINLDLLGGHGCCYDILDSTHIVTAEGALQRRRPDANDRRREAFRLVQRLRYKLRRHLLGFRYAKNNLL